MRRNVLSYRQNVKSKAGKVYKYRQYDPQTKRIRVEIGYGFKDGSLQKLSFKNGKLTKAGEEFRKELENAVYSSEREKNYTVSQFDKYVVTMQKRHQHVTPDSFYSHMKNEDYDRMLFNMNIDKQEVIDKLKAKYSEKINGEKITLDDDLIEKMEKEYKELYDEDIKFDHEMSLTDIVDDYFLLSHFIEFNYKDGWSLKNDK